MTNEQFIDELNQLENNATDYDDYDDLLNAGCNSGLKKAIIIKEILKFCEAHEVYLWFCKCFISEAISKGKHLKYFNLGELEELESKLKELTKCMMSGEDE